MAENDRPNYNLSQQLNQYVSQLQTEVGCFGKTLHQIVSHYLLLKSRHPSLALELEEIELPDSEQVTVALFERNMELLRRLQKLQQGVLQGFSQLQEHPWRGFGHFEHLEEHSDHFLRTIRFVGIQLTKFWVEVQSFPLFLNGLPNLSLKEIEAIFHWLKACPSWKDSVEQPRVIPALAQTDSRRGLFNFVRDVKSARVLQEQLGSQISRGLISHNAMETGLALLTQSVEWIRTYDLGTAVRADLVIKVEESKRQVNQVKKFQDFFTQIAQEYAFPKVLRPKEAKLLVQALYLVRSAVPGVLSLRSPRILGPSQLVRIKAWYDRARPVLETRRKLDSYFRLQGVTDSEKLRGIAADLSIGGLFKGLKSCYRNAVKAYRSLLRENLASDPKFQETPLQMSEKLLEWANYLDQSQIFENDSDLRSVFGVQARGVDTDFSLAIEANSWAARVRNELVPEESVFAQDLVGALFSCSEKKLGEILQLSESTEGQLGEALQTQVEFDRDLEFGEIQSEKERHLSDLSSLLSAVMRLEFSPESYLMELENTRMMMEEFIFLLSRMDSDSEVKACLRSFYLGIDTDLNLVDQGISFIQFIENASIPEALKASFLSAHGPQRLDETKALMETALTSLASLREHLERLDAATHGQLQDLVQGPIPDLMARIQNALKHPALLPSWVNYLRNQQEVRAQGLGEFLQFLERRSGETAFDVAYEIAFYASILKKTIGAPGSLNLTPDPGLFH